MARVNLEEEYSDLKEKFPEEFIFLFDSKGELNSQGKMAERVIELELECANSIRRLGTAVGRLKELGEDISKY